MNEIINELIKFRNERDWQQFHNAKDLALAINIEAGELLELFLWKNAEDANKEKDGFDVKEIILDKIKVNSEKYPVSKAKGTAKKYDEL
jgi:NTP pyrophosphatase (non-canonical NTP hydrolase)